MWRVVSVFVLLFSSPAVVLAADGSSPADAATDVVAMDTVVVTGEQPGPGLWKVGKGDHVLWVLGTLAPLPEKMQWRADEVARRIAESQVLLEVPGIELNADVGFFGRLALLPSLIGVRNNPDGKKLEDVVPADLYARWRPLKERYLGRGGKVEKWRPFFAAMELYRQAIRKNGMTVGSAAIGDRIKEFTRRAKIEPTPIEVAIDVARPRDAVRTFKKSGLDDIDCFAKTLDRLETDLGTMKLRANAWATGDLDALRALPHADQYAACIAAIRHSNVLQGAGDIEARIEQAWIDAAVRALEANASSFALLPMSRVVGRDSYLSKLGARGYRVDAPDGVEAAEPAAAPP